MCGWQDVLSEMADLAPMLKTLGYDPDDNHPTYGQVPISQSCIMIKPCTNGWSMKVIPLTSCNELAQRKGHNQLCILMKPPRPTLRSWKTTES